MKLHCWKCDETWNFEDYRCPCCDGGCIEMPDKELTLRYEFTRSPFTGKESYDVIRISTRKSVFKEKTNFWYKKDKLEGK